MNQRKVKNLDRMSKSKSEPKDMAFLDEMELTNDQLEENNILLKKSIEAITTLTEEVKKKYEPEVEIEIDREELIGDNGKDYVLTEFDKEEIALITMMDIEVPIVEKIIERTEVIKEQPIVNEITKYIENKDTPIQTRDKLESLQDDYRLDISAIKGLGKRFAKLTEEIINRAIEILDQRTSFLINKISNLQKQVNNLPAQTSSSFTVMIPTGVIDGSNVIYTFPVAPSIINIDNGITINKTNKIDGSSNWTGITTVTLQVQAPTSNIWGA